jgi:DNA-binding NarL/FixJ family response regulator
VPGTSPPITLLIADDHPTFRAGIRTALDGHGFHVCAEVGDGPAAVERAVATRPDVCLLDINMPGGGIAAAAAITERLPETSVVMLTVYQGDEELFAALRAGAAGYLLKGMDAGRLPHALRGVLAGEAALPRHLAARVFEEFRGARMRRRLTLGSKRVVTFTSREWDVLEALRDGLSTAEIAERMSVEPVTVRTYVRTVVRKLRVPDRGAVRVLLDELDRQRR